PSRNLAFGRGERDELHFEYLDRTAWHRARRPDDLADFFKDCSLTLSPAPSCQGLSWQAARTSPASWIEQLRAKEQSKSGKRPKRVLDFDKIVHAGFEARPDNASCGKRPYVFCAPDQRLEHYKSMMLLLAGHRDCSERFRAGERMVVFPEGTYPPPLLEAA
ncbi:MAG: hypothetical protein OXT09_27110, partial [Myxococcales bacterium]|nr:hypothetical protein [Myxococcales bacterium]